MRVRSVVSSTAIALLTMALAMVGMAPPSHADAASDLQAKFQSYGNTSSAWSGGDGTNSVKLPDGRILWFFADSYYLLPNGMVRNGGVRGPFDARMINNAMVIQNGTAMSTVAGGTDAAPQSLVTPATSGEFLWPADQLVSGGNVYKFYQRTAKTGDGPLDFKSKGVELVKMPVATITDPSTYTKPALPTSASCSPTAPSCLLWGTDLLTVGSWTYIYGTEVVPATATEEMHKYLHVARVPAGNFAAAGWMYWNGSTWQSNASLSKRLMDGAQEGFSVSYLNGRYVMLTQELAGGLGGDVVSYYASTPQGFNGSQRSRLYSTPETTQSYSRITYEYRIVEHLSSGNQIVVSYNVNSFNMDGACASETYWSAPLYRPRFKTLTLPATATGGADVLPTTPEPGSPWSVTPKDYCKPGTTTATPVPRSPVLTPASGARMTMTWTQPANPGAWNYDMQYRDVTAGQSWETMQAPGNTRTGFFFAPSPNRWDLSGLTPGHVYETRVRAGSWAGRQSAWVVSPRATAYLATPTGLTATRSGAAACRVVWTDSQPSVMWEISERNRRTGVTRTMLSGVKDTIITFLSADVFEYKVRAINSTGSSAWSAIDTC